jgi:calcineurin-like phosphoesterase family protein
MKFYEEAGFKKIFSSRKLVNLLLTHIPVHPDSIPYWAIGNVHGHIHERPAPTPRHYNVSVERINYTPIAIEDVQASLRYQQMELA